MEIDFVPIESYTIIYYNILLFGTAVLFFYTKILSSEDRRNLIFLRNFGFFLMFIIILYMGLRPNHEVFVDMRGYGFNFQDYQAGKVRRLETGSDYLFELFTYLSSKIMSLRAYYLTCALIYILPIYIVSKKLFKEFWFLSFFLFVVSLSFWGYGTNGIRNGLAASIFLLVFTKNNKFFQLFFMLVAIGFHKSLLLPSLAFLIAVVYTNWKIYLLFWLFSIPLSFLVFSALSEFLIDLGFDNRMSYLVDDRYDRLFSSSGFRWDFLVYSLFPIIVAIYYFKYFKLHEDSFYLKIFNTYLISNAFWILINEASFSNRFAYLSWFMMALVIIYPFIKVKSVGRYKRVGYITVLYFSLTYILNVIL